MRRETLSENRQKRTAAHCY